MKLICFDFDDTLVHTESPERGKTIWNMKTGKDWPYQGWWGRKESLDINIFENKLNKNVYEEYLKYSSDPENYIILATGRRDYLINEVKVILEKYNLTFDEIHLNSKGDTFNFKSRLFEKVIEKVNPTEFIMYDDRTEHIEKFKKWAVGQKCNIEIYDVRLNSNYKIKNK